MDYEFDGGALDGHTVTSVSGYSDMRANWVRDFDLTRAQNFFSQDPQKHEDYTQELTIDSPQDQDLRYSVGVNYFDVSFNLKTRQGVAITDSTGTDRVLNLQFNAGDADLEGFELENGFAFGENFSGPLPRVEWFVLRDVDRSTDQQLGLLPAL